MRSISIEDARRYVAAAELPPVHRARGATEPPSSADLGLETVKTQAAVVGSGVISFISGVTAERRAAIVNSALLAQLVATRRVADPTRIYDWYEAYFDVLTNIGWVVQDTGFAEYHEQSKNFEAHKAILAVATTLMGAAPTALAIVETTLDALRSMDENSPWITIFNRESQKARMARFQIGLADQDPDGQFFVSLMAFGLEAKSTVTQVLFFKTKATEATLRHYSGRLSINTAVLDAVREQIRTKLAGVANDYVRALPDLS